MKAACVALLCSLYLSGCAVVPVSGNQQLACDTASERQTLRMVNFAEESNSFFTLTNLLLSPIVVPVSTLVSGVYVVGNNAFNLAERHLTCSE